MYTHVYIIHMYAYIYTRTLYLKMLNTELHHMTGNSILSYNPRETKAHVHKNLHKKVQNSTIPNSQDWRTTHTSSNS